MPRGGLGVIEEARSGGLARVGVVEGGAVVGDGTSGRVGQADSGQDEAGKRLATVVSG